VRRFPRPHCRAAQPPHTLKRFTSSALASRSQQPDTHLRGALGLLLASGLGLTAPPATANPISTTDLAAVVEASKAQLRRSWAADPATARLPFPRVELLPPGVELSGACTPGAPVREPAPTAIYCARRDAVVLQHDLLTLAHRLHQSPAVTYWIAVGLAERVRPRDAALTPAASSLQVSCLAGVLVGAIGPAQSADATDKSVKAAAKAYGDLFSRAVGTGPQRAYALLSGLGATSLDCGAAAMARLATGQVSIPPDLSTRGPGSLGLEVSCRQPPACPRRLPSTVGVGGV
jgi:hypothetical protein